MRAALYARYSTDKQSEASIDDQFRVCEAIAERHGFKVAARYSDQAISGGTVNRPGYQNLLAAADRRDFEVIIAEDTSRLWRSLAVQAPRLAELIDDGIHVVTHDLDTRLESSTILSAINGAMAEQYRHEIARRTRRGLEGLARSGKPTGGRAYGYVSAAQSESGQQEIHDEHTATVRRIFEMYADGMSPRSIAAKLNEEGVPSPGSSWKREKRRKSKWLASAIWGDPKRGTGILNNVLYIGRHVWNRTRWVRSAKDSSKRRCELNPESEWIVREEERLRIVSDDLWARVKERQSQQSKRLGARVKGGLRKRAPGAGRPARYLFSGMLRCGLCGASFTLANKERYQCASHLNGRACENTISVRRSIVESRILDTLKSDLLNPSVIAEVEKRVRREIKRQDIHVDNNSRILELEAEIENLADAIASGLLKSSPALAQRLSKAEDGLKRLRAAQKPAPTTKMVPRVGERYRALVSKLEASLSLDVERARVALQDVIGHSVTLKPDDSGKFLWAEVGIKTTPMLEKASGSDLVVAGAGFSGHMQIPGQGFPIAA
jgi:DNA invertase Pin-like site-specific DNA recombinase